MVLKRRIPYSGGTQCSFFRNVTELFQMDSLGQVVLENLHCFTDVITEMLIRNDLTWANSGIRLLTEIDGQQIPV